MKTHYTAVMKKDSEWWIEWVEELPGVNCQEKNRDKLLELVGVTLREALEINRADALEAAGNEFEEFEIAV